MYCFIFGYFSVRMSSTEVDADSEADAKKCEAILPGIKVLWAVLEDYVKEGNIFFNLSSFLRTMRPFCNT